jgi:hypothetical protein
VKPEGQSRPELKDALRRKTIDIPPYMRSVQHFQEAGICRPDSVKFVSFLLFSEEITEFFLKIAMLEFEHYMTLRWRTQKVSPYLL